jgi:hypothetical protein
MRVTCSYEARSTESTLTYRWSLPIGKGAVDTIELELIVHVLRLELDVSGTID